MYIQPFLVRDFFNMMTRSGIRYVLLKNVSGELPEHLKDGKDIDILVHPDERNVFGELMKCNGYYRIDPPCGRKNGWNYAYLLEESEFWQKADIREQLYIDVNFRLCCHSLTPKTWVPLDESINRDVWRNRVLDKENNWWILDDATLFIYLVVRAVLDKQEFRNGYIEGINTRLECLEQPEVLEKLSKIFFRFTPKLVQMLREGSYDSIIESYITFSDY